MVVVNPSTLPERLRSAGFIDIDVDTDASAFRFRARKPFEKAAEEDSRPAKEVLQ
jgi:hypothetical protein